MVMAVSSEQLAGCALFNGFSTGETSRVADLMDQRTFTAGQTIIREGDQVQALWVVTAGQCEVVKSTRNGHDQQLAVLEPLSVFGEMSFFRPAEHSASVRSLTDVEILSLSRENFDILLLAEASTANKLTANAFNVLADRMRRVDEWVCHLVESPDSSEVTRCEWHEFRAKLYSDWDF